MAEESLKLDYLFEVSWEVCNKVGGIYTVLSSKYLSMIDELYDRYIFVGPDVWKETNVNPDFLEDNSLYKAWHENAEKSGLRIRIGRWNIPGKPIAVLIDFTPFFVEKDEIFAKFWETYQLDSLSGGWDYIEPALFGYAAGKVIESFYNFYLSANQKIISHFHEWMTGSGILYLKENTPQIGTVFTTHATVLGRSISGNNMRLYSELEKINSFELAKQLGIASKFSLEYNAAREADCFTTVSDITATECKYLLSTEVNVVTPNGFSDDLFPINEDFEVKRKNARNKIIEVTEAVINQKIDSDALLLLTSGRYEFRNKGLDVYIDALGKLNADKGLIKKVVAYIAVPASNAGARKDLQEMIGKPDFDKPLSGEYLTHVIYNRMHDPVLDRLKENKLTNGPECKVIVIFLPVYLNGSDGIFNMDYYEFLNGFDITVFPSYYEPWGYTPLESIAYKIPTITTSLAGFGLWAKSECHVVHHAVTTIERNEDNYSEVVVNVARKLKLFASFDESHMEAAREEAFSIASKLDWKILSKKYIEAYKIALEEANLRSDLFKGKQSVEYTFSGSGFIAKPDWKKIYVQANIPDELEPLRALSMNLWWSWDNSARNLFKSIDGALWKETDHNPVAILNRLSFSRLQELKQDEDFMNKMNKVYASFTKYMEDAEKIPEQQVAYFSMEYGLHESIKIYSGGLGILAGDYLKEASDSNKNIVGIGLVYRYGYFNQSLSLFGDQIAESLPQKFSELPLIPLRDEKGEWIKIQIDTPVRILTAKAWLLKVGRISLYLLDTDIEENTPEDRTVTHQLYGGDWNNRFRQELLLGVGGIRLLFKLGIHADIYHLNEGHAAFASLERLRHLMEHYGIAYSTAIEVVRSTTLFTTHTPVPAGHDTFSEDILRTYVPHYPERLTISWEDFMNLGRFHKNNQNEKFSMSVLASKLSQEMNGVSKIHGGVTQKMFSDLYPGYFPEELYIGYVTNGVHYPTWTTKNWQSFYLSNFGDELLKNESNPEIWKRIHQVSDQMVWNQRLRAKKEFLIYIREKISHDLMVRQENPKIILKTIESIDQNALYIGFARRFATYKRAALLFNNLEKLDSLINNEKTPVRFVFAGKAHPNDNPGKDLIKRVIEISKMPKFIGRIIFLENYDMSVGRKLISGVDVWLNTPSRPLEASGTSGEKAVMNGVLNLSVMDGWWAEGYRENAGWSIKETRTYGNQAFQDDLDAETIYQLLEDEIIPAFFDLDDSGIPHKWVSYIKNTLSEIAPHFTMKRMLDDYYSKYYNRLFERSKEIRKNNFEFAKKIESWKQFIQSKWSDVEVLSVRLPDSSLKPLNLGEEFVVDIILNTNNIPAENIGIEIVFGQKVNDKVRRTSYVEMLKLIKSNGSKATYSCSIAISFSGVFDFAFRIFPQADFLPHRQDFNLVKWI